MGVACSGLWAPDVYIYIFEQNVSVSGDVTVIYLLLQLFLARWGGGEGKDDRLHKS